MLLNLILPSKVAYDGRLLRFQYLINEDLSAVQYGGKDIGEIPIKKGFNFK